MTYISPRDEVRRLHTQQAVSTLLSYGEKFNMTMNAWVLIDKDEQTIEGVYPTRTEARREKSKGLLLKKALITVL